MATAVTARKTRIRPQSGGAAIVSIVIRRLCAGLSLATLMGLGGCTPCLGVANCDGPEHASVDGRILDGETGTPASGTRVVLFDRPSASDSSATTTDRDGLFSVSLPGTRGPLSLRVTTPGTAGYVIDSLPCNPVVGSDACVLPPITPSPWVPIHFFVTYRGSTDPVVGVKMHFIRTGGSQWFGPNAADVFDFSTDFNGIALPFPSQVYATSMAPVIGELVAELPGELGTSTRSGFLVHPIYSFYDRPLDIFQMGPSLDYAVSVVDSVSLEPVAGVTAQFTRTGGIDVAAAEVSAVTEVDGRARLPLRALAVGTVEGRLVLRAPGVATADTVNGFSLPTFDNDSTRSAGTWRLGPTGRFQKTP